MREYNEDLERESETCCGCGSRKDKGLVVCWECFKRVDIPFKTFNGTLAQWVDVINK